MGGSQFNKAQHAQKHKEEAPPSRIQQSSHVHSLSHSHIITVSAPSPSFHYMSAPYLIDVYNVNFTMISVVCLFYILWSMRRP